MMLTTTRTMWTMSPTPSRPSPCVPRLSIGSTTSKPPQRCFALAVTNKFQRRPPPQNYGDDPTTNNSAQDVGGLGLSVLTALKSNPQIKPLNPRPQNSTSSIKTSNSKQRSREQEDRQLSGSDVLLALQRATTHKNKKKRRDYPSSEVAKNRARSGTDQEDEEEEDTWDYSNARPICIKSDWTTRLDVLEKRLQELIDTAVIQ